MRLGRQDLPTTLCDHFEVELARALTGGPLPVTSGFGLRTDLALIELALLRPHISETAIARARLAFASENDTAHPTEGVLSSPWPAILCYRAATTVAAALIAWYSKTEHGSPTDRPERAAELAPADAGPTTEDARRRCYQSWARLNPADIAATRGWLHDFGPLLPIPSEPESESEVGHAQMVGSWRLSPDAQSRVLSDQIIVELCADMVASPHPTASFGFAPLEVDNAVVIAPAILAAFHPHWWDALWSGDPVAGAIIAVDTAGWLASVVEYVAKGRADLVVAIDVAADSAYPRLLRAWGYEVRVATTSVPEPIARLDTLLAERCARGDWRLPLIVAGQLPQGEQAADG